MIKRPKPGEDEDDLLELQRQFMAQKTAPSANVVSKAGDKRKTGPDTGDGKIKRDVVQMDTLPPTQPSTEQVPPVKKSRFKAAQEKKAHSRPSEKLPSETGEPSDELDTSVGTVLTKIIERDTRSAQFRLPTPMSQAFPSVVSASNKTQSEGGKKKSVFAQQFEKAPDVFGVINEGPILKAGGEGQVKNPSADYVLPAMVDGSGLSATFGKNEAQKIHQENANRLAGMSQEEIIQEQRKLLESLDPSLVEFLKARKGRKEEVSSDTHMEEEKPESAKPKLKKKKQEAEVPLVVDSTWVNMDKLEHDKLEWMKDLPPPAAGDTKTGQQARFDFQGNLIPPGADVPVNVGLHHHGDEPETGQQARFDFQGNLIPPGADVPVNVGLHHHGDEPERAGYTLEELFMLARSSNIQQRALALITLARVITQAKAGSLSQLVQSPVFPSVLDAGMVFLVRWSLDDSVDSVVVSAVTALNAILVNQADEMALDKVFHWYQGHRVACQAPVIQESIGIKLPDAPDEKGEETDADVAKQDLVKALVYRMNLLPRLRHVLITNRPHAPTVVEILQILTRLARHSTQLAYEVFNQKGLVRLIVDNFLPLSWKAQDVTQPLSLVYGVPLTAALKLVRTLCQAGRHIAAKMMSDYQLEDRLLRYLADDASNLGLPESEASGLQIESLNAWKSCLSYSVGDSLYIELYPKIIETLRENLDPLTWSSERQTHLAALIGTLEVAICVISSPKVQGFKHSQDGGSIETERGVELIQPMLNWGHVEGLIQPVGLLLKSTLSVIANTYQIKKQNLIIPSVCLNFAATFFTKYLAQTTGLDTVSKLDEVKSFYTDCIQHWNSFGFVTIRSKLSQHSNLLHSPEFKSTEQHASLPEYGSTSTKKEEFLPTISLGSPYNFIASYLRFILNVCKIHKGLFTSSQDTSSDESTTSVSYVLQCPDILTYLRKLAPGKLCHLSGNYFTKFENYLQYFIIKLATIQACQSYLASKDRSVLHNVALTLLTNLHHGDEHLTHDLLSTCIFNSTFWKQEQEDTTAIKLEELSLAQTPTHLRSATEKDVTFTLDQLTKDAVTHLTGIRSTYLQAFAYSEGDVIKSRYHYHQMALQTDTCYTSSIGECLLPRDWMFVPLIELYNKYASVGAEIQNILSASQLDSVRNMLRWIFLMELERPGLLGHVSVTLKLSRIMCVFLTGNDMFLDKTVHCFMAGLLRHYTKPSLLQKIDFTENIPGLTSFYDLFVGLLQQYEAVSFGDSLFGCYVLLPLQQQHSIEYRRAVWTEYTGILRTLSVSVSELLVPIQCYLEPEEVDVSLLRLYFQSVYSLTLRPVWSPVLYLMAVHHVNRFLYSQDRHHKQLKVQMMRSLMACKHEEAKKHLIYYKNADVSLPNGIELYDALPPIRQKYLDSIKTDS